MKSNPPKKESRVDTFIANNWEFLIDPNLFSDLNKKISESKVKIPRSFWQKKINSGFIKLGQKKIKSGSRIDESQKKLISIDWKNILKDIEICYLEKIIPYPGNLNVIYEDNNFLVINKSAPISTHPAYPITDSNVRDASLVDQIMFRQENKKNLLNQRVGVVHRLDKKTTGLILWAKNREYERYLKNLFKKRLIEKEYLALVEGEPKNDNFEIRGWMGKWKKNPLKRFFMPLSEKNPGREIINPKESLSKVKLLLKGSPIDFQKAKSNPYQDFYLTWLNLVPELFDSQKKYSLLKIKILTGRTHQIRVHLASLKIPIVGDELYGIKPKTNYSSAQALHSYKISFRDKNKKAVKIINSTPIFT